MLLRHGSENLDKEQIYRLFRTATAEVKTRRHGERERDFEVLEYSKAGGRNTEKLN